MQNYFQLQNQLMNVEQVILATLFCEILVIIYSDEDAKIGAFLCEMSLCGAFIMTNVMSAMGPVMTGLTYTMIIRFIIKLIVMTSRLPVIVRHRRLVKRCKKACEQSKWPTMAEDICLICQAYCRQVRQKVK